MTIIFLVPPRSPGVISDYAGGFGFEPLDTYVLPPLDLLQLAAVVKKEHPVELIDFSWEPNASRPLDRILNQNPTTVIVQGALPTLKNDIVWARQIRAHGVRALVRLPTLHSVTAKAVNAHPDDEWLLGECEYTILSILHRKNAHGLARGCKSGILPAPIEELDNLPFPARHLVAELPYSYPKLGACVTAQFSRGCPFGCSYYCPYPLAQGKYWRRRSVDSMLTELHEVTAKAGCYNIFFRDAVFSFDQEHTKNFCFALVEENLKISWWCETRADALRSDTIQAMAKAGCAGVNIGIESGNEALRLKRLKSKTTNSLISETTDKLRTSGIKFAFLLMLGWPGETREAICETAEIIYRCRPDAVGIVFPTAYPGTSFYQEMAYKESIETNKLPTAGDIPTIYSPTMSFNEMRRGKQLLENVAQKLDDPRSLNQAKNEIRNWAAMENKEDI